MRFASLPSNRVRRSLQAVSIALLAGAALLPAASADAQAPVPTSGARAAQVARQPNATRAALETVVREGQERATGDGAPLLELARRRLDAGDFVEGEQIVLRVAAQPALSDTFTVQSELTLPLPGIEPAALRGVLRSELQAHLAAHVARFVRDAQVSAHTLIRVGVLGEVRSPGFYRVHTATTLSEVLMAAGGPTSEADVDRVSVRRALAAPGVRPSTESLALTRTMDDLALQSGDQVVVAAVRRRNWAGVSQVTTLVLGVLLAVGTLTR